MSNPSLLPCPFCGGMNVRVDDCSDEVFRKVSCECGASGPVCGTEDEDEEHGHAYAKAAERDAIAAWNAAPRSGKALTRFTEPRSFKTTAIYDAPPPAELEIVDDGTGRTRAEVNATIDGVVAAATAIAREASAIVDQNAVDGELAKIWNELSDTKRDLLLYAYHTRDRNHGGVLDVAGSGAGWHRTARSLAERHQLFVCAHPGGPRWGEWRLTELGTMVAEYGNRQPKPEQKRRAR